MTSRLTTNDGRAALTSMTTLSSLSTNVAMQNPTHVQAAPANFHAPLAALQQSQSVPATPSQRPHASSDERRSPSLSRTMHNSSPRSLHSDSSQTPPAPRKHQGGCKYETGMARARRRVPYSLGPEKLESEKLAAKRNLSQDEEKKLTADMQTLFAELVPSPESEARRARFVEKLEKILRGRWPTASIEVNVFGSTGNNLGTRDSDVDICITTDSKELTKVCSIADLLAKHGMERVVCVSSAKVPIVKVWDPELQVACDMNVNNPIALENTDLVKSYVAIDPRVRPLAMIIKHWAKRRILNDAALGGTLSSYTWICLALNFLQTRNPPILPSLQEQACGESRLLGGVNVAFDRNLNTYENFGVSNTSTLGELLLQFFRYYGHEFDFEESVVSVRQGKVLPKSEKGWHLLQDNRLCVEEPFNTSRNLANTADDTSMRGIHLELRRAFGLVADGHLDKCCEQFVYPPDEVRPSEHFVPPSSRPVIAQLPTQPSRGGKGTARGGRNTGSQSRNVNGRRSSNPTGRGTVYLRNLPFQMTTQELQIQQQHQQHLLHDQLFQQYQYLQLQEQELRMQLHQQNLRSRGLLPSGNFQTPVFGTYATQDENGESTSNGGLSSMSRAPLSAPLYQHRFGSPSPYLMAAMPSAGVVTNPSSPRLSSAVPDTRRYSRRTSMTPSTNGTSLRAQSQPARPMAAATVFNQIPNMSDLGDLNGRRSSTSSTSHDAASSYFNHSYGIPGAPYDVHRRPAEYVGYYVGQSPSLLGYPPSASISPIPSHAGLAIQNGGLSPSSALSSPQLSKPASTATSTEPLGEKFGEKVSQGNSDKPCGFAEEQVRSPKIKTGPLIVNGSHTSPLRRRLNDTSKAESEEHVTVSTSTSEDLAFDTPSSSDENSQDPLEIATRATGSPLTATRFTGVRESLNGTKLPNGHAESFLPPRDGDVSVGDKKALPSRPGHSSSESQQPMTAWSLGRQLSSVQEVSTPSPGQPQEKRNSLLSASTPLDHDQGDLGQGPSRPNEAVITSYDDGTLSAIPNGSVGKQGRTVEAGPVISAGTWQTQKKKKKSKKAVKSENDAQSVNPSGGDFLPVDESQRKGG